MSFTGVSTINRLPNKIFLSKKKTSDDRLRTLPLVQAATESTVRWIFRSKDVGRPSGWRAHRLASDRGNRMNLPSASLFLLTRVFSPLTDSRTYLDQIENGQKSNGTSPLNGEKLLFYIHICMRMTSPNIAKNKIELTLYTRE